MYIPQLILDDISSQTLGQATNDTEQSKTLLFWDQYNKEL